MHQLDDLALNHQLQPQKKDYCLSLHLYLILNQNYEDQEMNQNYQLLH